MLAPTSYHTQMLIQTWIKNLKARTIELERENMGVNYGLGLVNAFLVTKSTSKKRKKCIN